MSDESPVRHPDEFRRLCARAVDAFRALAAAQPSDRGALVRDLRALLSEIDRQVDEMDLTMPGFAAEQGWLVDAATALESIDLDRGGPHVTRYTERAIADLQRVAG